MNKLILTTSRPSLVLTFIFCLMVNLNFAQIKKGFKYLESREWEKAKKAFEKDLNDAEKKPFARFGLMRVALHESKRNVKSIAQTVDDNENLLAAFEKPTAQQAKWMKAYKITKRSPSGTRNRALTLICDVIDETNTFPFYDAFATENGHLLTEMDTCLRETRLRLVEDAYRHSDDYEELTILYNKYQADLQLKNLRFSKDFDARIVDLFIKKYGYEKLRRFREDHPIHWVSLDCWLDNFVDSQTNATTNTEKGRASLRFLNSYPKSVLNSYATKIARENPITEGANDELLRLQFIRLQDSIARASNRLDSAHVGTYTSALRRWLAYPFTCSESYYWLKSFTQALLDVKADTEAAAILSEARLHYPDGQPKDCTQRYTFYANKQRWFDSATHHILAPRQNIKREKMDNINTIESDEFSPVISLDGTTLYFCRASKNKGNADGEDIYVSYGVNKLWSKPVKIKELSGKSDQSPLSITADGRTMLLSVNGKLRQSHLDGSTWSSPKPLSNLDKYFSWTGKATMTADGKTILLEASYNPDAQQSYSSQIYIYALQQNDTGGWKRPIRLPETINVPFAQTRAPFIAVDNRTLYYSTNGIEGLGDADLFVSKRLDDTWVNWSTPVNLGKEFNSTSNDWGLNLQVLPNGRTAFWATNTNREELDNDKGGLDIYTIELPSRARAEPMARLTTKVIGRNLSLTDYNNAKIQIVNMSTGKTVAEAPIKNDGTIDVLIPSNIRYTLRVQSKNIFPVDKIVDLTTETALAKFVSTDSIAIVTENNMVKEGQAAPISGLLFGTNLAILSDESYAGLERLYDFVKDKIYEIEITGHTDNTGTDAENEKLSLARATAVKNYLVGKGINAQWIKTTGKGSREPIKPNDTDANKQQNRRVEINLRSPVQVKGVNKN